MFGWKNRRKQLLQEFEAHIETETRDNIDRGMSPADARQAAHRKFGSVPLAVEQSREALGGLWLERLGQDIRYALRSLRGVPAYAATLILTLALGLGCATTMLAVIVSVLMRPVALPDPGQLVQLYSQQTVNGTHLSPEALNYTEIDQLRRDNHSFSGISGYNTTVRPVAAADGTRIAVMNGVTPDFFAMLGVQPKSGRLLLPSDAHAPVAVVNEAFWRERLHSDPKAVGSSIKIAGQPTTILGILPDAIHVPQATGGPAVYIPLALSSDGQDVFKMDSASTLARLKPGITKQQALADAQSIFAHLNAAQNPSDVQARQLAIRSYQDLLVGDLQQPLIGLLGGVIVLLLIACANAANLQIGRAASRMSEMNVRSALGASFGRLLQQLITESILVSLLSATLGGAVAYIAVQLIRHAYADQFPRFDELAIRPTVFLGTALLAVLVGIAASIAPALNIRRNTSGNTGARVNAKNVTRSSRLPGILVALQVALTCVLLVTSGLFVRTLQQLESVSLGFDPHGVTTLVLMPENQNQDITTARNLDTRVLHRLESLPGIQSVTMQTSIPFSSWNMDLDGTTDVEGHAFQKGDNAHYSFVSTSFVQTSGIHLVKGRAFQAQDETSAAINAIVNQAFVKKYLGDRDPLGVTLKFHRNPGETDADQPIASAMTIVGVVANEVQGGDLGAPYQPMVYIDYLQLPANSMLAGIFTMASQYAIRSPLPSTAVAAEIRRAIKEEAPSMTEMNLHSMEEGVAESLGQRRLALRLVSGFGLVALVLSAIGIYGVLAYSVALRRREIGIRMALGSSRPKVAKLVLTQAATMVLLGLIPGIAGAWAAAHALGSFLYGVSPLDPQTLLAVAAILLVVSAAAATQPTLRAAQVDPVETLRAE
jgi:predicted permease